MPKAVKIHRYMGVPEMINHADAYFMMTDADKKVWNERIDKLDLRDRSTWECLRAGMNRRQMSVYMAEYYPTINPDDKNSGNDQVRRLNLHINREIMREKGELI
jgi:hypothetical protein